MSDTEVIKNDIVPAEVEPAIREMIEAGVFYGRTKRKTNPRMKAWIAGNRNGIEIVDLEKTKDALDATLAVLKEKATHGVPMLLVATQPAAREAALAFATEFEMPFVSTRWLGGTLTNFKVISNRVDYFRKLKSDVAAGVYQKYTKKEQLMVQRELARLTELLETMSLFTRVPSIVIILDTNLHLAATREAKLLKIPTIAFMNTDADPDLVHYPIVGNNKAKSSLQWFLEKIGGAIREGKKAMAAAALEAKEAVEVKKEG